jgi:hypothetical protein
MTEAARLDGPAADLLLMAGRYSRVGRASLVPRYPCCADDVAAWQHCRLQ